MNEYRYDKLKSEGAQSVERLVLGTLIKFTFMRELPWYATEDIFKKVIKDRIDEMAGLCGTEEMREAFLSGANEAFEDLFDVIVPSPASP